MVNLTVLVVGLWNYSYQDIATHKDTQKKRASTSVWGEARTGEILRGASTAYPRMLPLYRDNLFYQTPLPFGPALILVLAYS